MPEVPSNLVYVTDAEPGIRRVGAGRGFCYRYPDGTKVCRGADLDRIRSLVIPPAYRDVWICVRPEGHLQATGRDARGRKQYRYHPDWRTWRDAHKYDRLALFAEALPRIRRRVTADLRRSGMPREKVLAMIVRLMEASYFRVGNERYAEENESYGLTTLREEHVAVRADTMAFSFIGKSGREHHRELADQRLARMVRRLQDLPGQQLFQYRDTNGAVHPVHSEDVNAYLASVIPEEGLTAKYFRTWGGTVLATRFLWQQPDSELKTERHRQTVEMVKEVASQLGNRPATCRKYYIHPAVSASYVENGWSDWKQRHAGERQTERFFERRAAEIVAGTAVSTAA